MFTMQLRIQLSNFQNIVILDIPYQQYNQVPKTHIAEIQFS